MCCQVSQESTYHWGCWDVGQGLECTMVRIADNKYNVGTIDDVCPTHMLVRLKLVAIVWQNLWQGKLVTSRARNHYTTC